MIIQEQVSNADRVKIPSDFESGDIVSFFVDGIARCGIVQVSTSSKLSIQLKADLFVFDATSEISVDDALQNVEKLPEFHNIKAGIFMSRMLEFEPGDFIREYVEVKDVETRKGQLQSVTVEFQNGEFIGERLTMDTSTWDELWRNLSGWEIEE